MAGIHNRFVAAVAIVAIAGFSLTACSKSNKAKTVTPNTTAASQAAQGNGGAAASSAGSGAGPVAGTSAAAGGNTLLATGPACQILTAADVQAAVGMPLGNITGDISGGPQGATDYHSCIWTKDASGEGAAVNVAYGTYASASGELAAEKARDAGTADQLNSLAPNSQTVKDVSVGDGGYELTTNTGDDSITFTKGQQVVQVEVIKGVADATMVIAQKVASKL
ncbi:MAG TPA: hypothetical protein VGL75_14630 [Acidothermaceae bacterium]|jgi:hypothetical protein